MRFWVVLVEREYSGMTEMVVVGVGYDDYIDQRNVFDLARRRGVPLRSEPGEGRAAILEHRVEQDTQTRRELDEVACMTEPGRSDVRRGSA